MGNEFKLHTWQLRKIFSGLEEWLGSLQARTDLLEDQDSILRIHTVPQNHLELQFQGIQSPLLVSSNTRHMCGETDIYEGKTPITTSMHVCKHLDLTGEGREGRITNRTTHRNNAGVRSSDLEAQCIYYVGLNTERELLVLHTDKQGSWVCGTHLDQGDKIN